MANGDWNTVDVYELSQPGDESDCGEHVGCVVFVSRATGLPLGIPVVELEFDEAWSFLEQYDYDEGDRLADMSTEQQLQAIVDWKDARDGEIWEAQQEARCS